MPNTVLFDAITAKPLIIGARIIDLAASTLQTLFSTAVIAIDQDALGIVGTMVNSSACGRTVCQIWVRRAVAGCALAFFNYDSTTAHSLSIGWSAAGLLAGTSKIHDAWAHSDLARSATGYTASSIPAWIGSAGSYLVTGAPFEGGMRKSIKPLAVENSCSVYDSYVVLKARPSISELAILPAALVCLLYTAEHISGWIRVVTLDVSSCYLPWYQELLRLGRFHGVAGAYANYTPPTLYLFALASLLGRWITPVVLLKAINLPFILTSSGLVYEIGRKLGGTKRQAAFTSFLAFALPEVWQNAFHWGQYDSVFTTFLLACCFMMLVRKPTVAMLLLGVALAFKLQTVFVGPAILALFVAGEIPLYSVAAVPVAYLACFLPAALAGRPWGQLLTIYSRQFDTYPSLSVDAPNVYFLVQPYIGHGVGFRVASACATLLAVIASLWLVWWYRRESLFRWQAERVAALFAASLLLLPFLLPRMHERYFFAGDVFAAVLLAARPRLLTAVVLLQASALLTYHQYFVSFGYVLFRRDFVVPMLLLAVAIALIVHHYAWKAPGQLVLNADEK